MIVPKPRNLQRFSPSKVFPAVRRFASTSMYIQGIDNRAPLLSSTHIQDVMGLLGKQVTFARTESNLKSHRNSAKNIYSDR